MIIQECVIRNMRQWLHHPFKFNVKYYENSKPQTDFTYIDHTDRPNNLEINFNTAYIENAIHKLWVSSSAGTDGFRASLLVKPQSQRIVRFFLIIRLVAIWSTTTDRQCLLRSPFTIARSGVLFTIGCRSYVNLHDNLCIHSFWPDVGRFIVNICLNEL